MALARVPVHLPARRAPLARVMRLDLLHPAGRFVLQSAYQQAPPGPQDLAVEPGLGADVPARVLRRASRGPGHVRDLQVLDPDHVEPPRDAGAGLLGPVLAPVGLAGPQPGDRVPRPSAAVPSRAAPWRACAPGAAVASAPARSGRARAAARPVDRAALTATPRSMPTTSPLPGAGIGSGTAAKATCQRPGAVHRHPVGLHARGHGAGPAEPHPPGLGHPDLADFAGHPAHVPLPAAPPGDPEPLIPPGLAPRRPPGRVRRVEERRHRPGEVAQGLLLDRLGAGGQPRVLRSRLR